MDDLKQMMDRVDLHQVLSGMAKGLYNGVSVEETMEELKALTSNPTYDIVLEDKLDEILDEHLCDYLYCNRAWSAWGAGSMTENDFYPIEGSEDLENLKTDILKLFRNGIGKE